MDSLDRAIIEALTLNAKLTNQELAARVGLTPAPCLRRVRKLEEDGIITGYTTVLNHQKIDGDFEVIINAEIATTKAELVRELEKKLASFPEVVELRRMFGLPDYIMRVRVKDAESYERWYTTYLSPLSDITRIDSRITMKILK